MAVENLEDCNELTDPPSSVERLLSALDQIDSHLSRVEQSPSSSTLDALSPSIKALVANKLLRHSDADVKVAVASCISQLTRITAPESPYGDDQMKEVFELIVSSFENLYDKTSRSYAKRTSILETVAKVRLCVIMLDLECDALILKMFQHFLKEIREHHPNNVFTYMEMIMTLILEEIEDIPVELLSPLLDSVKKDNEEVFPIAKKLGERVLENCAAKVKPYLLQAVKSLGISMDDYSMVLASICQDAFDSLEQNDLCEQREEKCKSAKQSSEESEQVVKEGEREAVPSQPDNLVGDRSPKSAMSNGVAKKHSAKKLDVTNKGGDGFSSRKPEKKESGQGKASSEKDVAKSSTKDVDEELVSSPRSGNHLVTTSAKDKSLVKTPKTNVKRKCSSGTENESDIKKYCHLIPKKKKLKYRQNLVGLRIKVWWPEDQEFYKGVIDSFDPATKTHKVHYDDDEVEILRLRKETWKIIEPADSDSYGEERSDHASLASADVPPEKKGKTSASDSIKQRKMDASTKQQDPNHHNGNISHPSKHQNHHPKEDVVTWRQQDPNHHNGNNFHPCKHKNHHPKEDVVTRHMQDPNLHNQKQNHAVTRLQPYTNPPRASYIDLIIQKTDEGYLGIFVRDSNQVKAQSIATVPPPPHDNLDLSSLKSIQIPDFVLEDLQPQNYRVFVRS